MGKSRRKSSIEDKLESEGYIGIFALKDAEKRKSGREFGTKSRSQIQPDHWRGCLVQCAEKGLSAVFGRLLNPLF